MLPGDWHPLLRSYELADGSPSAREVVRQSLGRRACAVSPFCGRFGRLAEILLYDIRRSQTLAGPRAVFVDGTVEAWLKARMTAREVVHVVNIPSNPPGWSAGKWGEWYPDILDRDGRLTINLPKPYWQSGWLKQRDRLMAAVAGMPGRIPLIISGDLHAIAEGRMQRSGALDFSRKPIIVVLSGPLGTGDRGWPSAFRGIGATPPVHLQMEENLKPVEENGFIIADFTTDGITIRFFRFNYHKRLPPGPFRHQHSAIAPPSGGIRMVANFLHLRSDRGRAPRYVC